ncbi:cryptochrome/photolyase family protein [Methylophaga thalassica]|uniref:Cryptochrome/photolyase family protein n=1 Tax=Methylophaga thalassica TaxID=40223 RepID=A0ABQ5TXB5_9GAMM|nr:cryptochrome/photolyase family protein [Methylophaga thalassica]GLQ00238.1 cryptochrome/photolyase family protein [Methylophaga thalassica]
MRLNLILGDQLNWDSLIWQDIDQKNDIFWMAEISQASLQPPSNKQRSVVFLSAMRHFAEDIQKKHFQLLYSPITDDLSSFTDALKKTFTEHKIDRVRCVLPGDYLVMQEIEHAVKHHQLEIDWLKDVHFIAKRGEFSHWLKQRKKPTMEYWYRHLRESRQILIDNGKPQGGQWNFDKSNRQSFSKQGPDVIKESPNYGIDEITQDVIDTIKKDFSQLPGTIDTFNWPVTRRQALIQLRHFIDHYLPFFGDYQDAMWTEQPFLYHARLSASLNLKLLQPQEVIEAAEQAYKNNKAPLNAVEGFIRQILGWREYIRGLYWAYRKDWLQFNALKSERDLPDFYWTADTDMQCLHQAIKQVLDHGYGHHIQRLMVTGLFALLWQVHPKHIHHWYLGMYVDAVSWVEVPNTIGMSQYADGGIVGSKPYIASGAYINRMSNYCQHCPFDPKQASGDKACPFTTLYWYFIDQHNELISHNPRLAMQAKNWAKKSNSEQQAIRERAEWLFQHLDTMNKEA